MAYGDGDASLCAMGGEPGVAKLVERFYDLMETLPEVTTIREMHPADLGLSREKLTAFLTAWLGGPKRYSERWGTIRIPRAHARFPIGPDERDQWLLCMDRAIDEMDVASAFANYFKGAIRVPANRIVTACQRRAAE
ncbi:MAG: group II truncated hemoglobin [Myxococcota bacterium]